MNRMIYGLGIGPSGPLDRQVGSAEARPRWAWCVAPVNAASKVRKPPLALRFGLVSRRAVQVQLGKLDLLPAAFRLKHGLVLSFFAKSLTNGQDKFKILAEAYRMPTCSGLRQRMEAQTAIAADSLTTLPPCYPFRIGRKVAVVRVDRPSS